MSKTRQRVSERLPHLRAAAVGFSAGYRWRSPAGAWGQLLSTTRGTMTVEAAERVHVVPSAFALWLPPHTENAVWLSGKGTIRRIYLRGAPCARMPREVESIRLTPLVIELLRRTIAVGVLDHRRVREARLIDVFVDELTSAPRTMMDLPMPRDARALRAAAVVRADLAAARDASAVARKAGASVRTLERLFDAETGMSFGAWRQRARLLQSLEHLANGETVAQTALAVGYAGASGYVAAFRREVGVTPRRYVTAGELQLRQR